MYVMEVIMLSVFEAYAVHVMTKLQNLAKRMEKYGAVSLSTYKQAQPDVNDVTAWNRHVLQLVYADSPTTEDAHIVYESLTQDHESAFQDMEVLYTKPTDGGESFLYIKIPITNGTHLSFVIGHDGVIEPMGIQFMTNQTKEDMSNDFQ